MRAWMVAGVLTIMVVATLALRTRSGWSATPREVLQISCERRAPEHCTDLGLDLLRGTHGPVDQAAAMTAFQRGCELRSGRGCYMAGSLIMDEETLDAHEEALESFERGCELRHFDSCAYAGWIMRFGALGLRDLTTGATRLADACGNDSAMGCTYLGELAFSSFPSATQRLASARSFERGCELNNSLACLRHAQGLACGRGGGEPDQEVALARLIELCAKGTEPACEQRLVLERPDAGIEADGAPLARAVLRASFSAGEAGRRVAANRGLASIDGGMGVLARAAVAIGAEQFDEAETLLAALPTDGGHPEVEVARQTLAVRREGQPFPEAAWLGWRRAGRPDLRKAKWLPTSNDFVDRGTCWPSRPFERLTTPEAFIRAAKSNTNRSKLDAPFDPEVVRAAMRYSTTGELPARMVALTVLARVAKDDTEVAVREFEASARTAFAEGHHTTLFFSLLQTPSDLRTGAASEADLAALEQTLTLPTTSPRRELFDAFVRVFNEKPETAVNALSMTVYVMLEVLDLEGLAAWMERGAHPAPRRARILRKLGEAISTSGWLVDGYVGLRLLRASAALEPDGELDKRIQALDRRLDDVRTGPRGVKALGVWPWQREPNTLDVMDREIAELERLKSLAEAP